MGKSKYHCSRHPKYKAIKYPTSGCAACIQKYGQVHNTGTVFPSSPGARVVTKKLINRIAILLDDSGSMEGIASVTKDALNRTIRDIKENAKKAGQKTFVSFYTFGSVIVKKQDQLESNWLGELNQYRPNAGSTRLFDAVSQAITDLARIPVGSEEDVSNLLIVVTDGQNNAGSDQTGFLMNKNIREVQATDRWTITFQLPPNAKARFCNSFGVPEGNVVEWEQTTVGVERATQVRTQGVSNYYTARASGQTATMDFYTDLSNVTTAQVKAKLGNVRSMVNVWSVEKECELRPFVEGKLGGPMLKGASFYQLTKTEKKVQDYKQIIIMEKNKNAVYAGDEARSLLGLPSSGNVRIIPGNHGNYDIFIQSNSTNRKLVRGTKVIYYATQGVAFKEGPSAQAPA